MIQALKMGSWLVRRRHLKWVAVAGTQCHQIFISRKKYNGGMDGECDCYKCESVKCVSTSKRNCKQGLELGGLV